MTPWDPTEERMQTVERKVAELDARVSRLECTECGRRYPSVRAAEACADEDRKPDFHD